MELDRIAVDEALRVVELAESADWDRDTPCAGWNLRRLVAHMTAQHLGFAAAARGAGLDTAHWQEPPDMDDPAPVHRVAATAVLAAFAEPGATERSSHSRSWAAAFPDGRPSASTSSTTWFTPGTSPQPWERAWNSPTTSSARHSPQPDGYRPIRPSAGLETPSPRHWMCPAGRDPRRDAAPVGPGAAPVARSRLTPRISPAPASPPPTPGPVRVVDPQRPVGPRYGREPSQRPRGPDGGPLTRRYAAPTHGPA